MDKILAKNDFARWLEALASYRLYAPQNKDEVWTYEPIESPEGRGLADVMTAVPATKIVFPQREELFSYEEGEDGDYALSARLPAGKPTVIFGLRPCEAKAVTLTDLVFGGEFAEEYYWRRRNAVTFVGLACLRPPSPDCFCLSVNGSPHGTDGLDILLTDLGETYFVESLTEKDETLLRAAPGLFSDPKPDEKSRVMRLHGESEKKIRRSLSTHPGRNVYTVRTNGASSVSSAPVLDRGRAYPRLPSRPARRTTSPQFEFIPARFATLSTNSRS